MKFHKLYGQQKDFYPFLQAQVQLKHYYALLAFKIISPLQSMSIVKFFNNISHFDLFFLTFLDKFFKFKSLNDYAIKEKGFLLYGIYFSFLYKSNHYKSRRCIPQSARVFDLLGENVKSGFSTDGRNLRPPAVKWGNPNLTIFRLWQCADEKVALWVLHLVFQFSTFS